MQVEKITVKEWVHIGEAIGAKAKLHLHLMMGQYCDMLSYTQNRRCLNEAAIPLLTNQQFETTEESLNPLEFQTFL